MGSLKKTATNGCLYLLAGAIGVVTLEYYTRWALPQYDPRGSLVFLSDEKTGATLGPKMTRLRQFKNTGDFDVYVDFNKYGLRDKKDVAQSTEEDYFVVGGSFSFGWGVGEEERYSNLLQEKLRTNVFNICTTADFNGYRALIEYAKAHGARIKKLIVGVSMELNLRIYEEGHAPSLSPESAVKRLWTKVKLYLSRRSAAYVAISTVVHQNPILKGMAVRSGLLVENIAGMSKNVFSETIIGSSIHKLAEITRPYDATVLIIPSRGLWVGNNTPTEKLVHDRFVASLKEAGLDVVDMRPIFEKTGKPIQFHFKNDGHWNSLGHRKAAEVLAAHILSKAEQRATPISSPAYDPR